MEIRINNVKITYKYSGIGWGDDYNKMVTKEWITPNWLAWFKEKYKIKHSDKTIIKNIHIEKVAPNTFPKYNNEHKIKIKGYNLVNPTIEMAEWNCCEGWTYRFKNLGHQFQSIREEDISFV